MPFTYLVLGAGRQGTAAGYDFLRWGDAERVILADAQPEIASAAAERLQRLSGGMRVEAVRLDVTDSEMVRRTLNGVDAVLSAVPYYYNLELTRLAIEAGCHMADLGGNTQIVMQQHRLDPLARQAGVSILPDCGQVPGMGTVLMVYTLSQLDQAQDVYMWDGGIPENPRPPFNYLLTFNIAGLTNEYAEPGIFLRDGKITHVEPMTEVENVEFPEPIGQLEAFVAGGGTSTMPFTYEGKLRTLQNLTLRWPGHYQQLRAFWDLGLWSQEPVRVGETDVVPRQIFHALFEPKVTFPEDRDIVLIRVKAVGIKDGCPAVATLDLIDRADEQTGFTAMERATGWGAAIVLEMAARDQTPPGSMGLETAVPAGAYVDELRRRGMNLTERLEIQRL